MSVLDPDFRDADVIDSFQALDMDGRGFVTLEDLQTIYLGLGFMPTRFATLPNLRKELGHNRLEISLHDTITLLGKHHRKDTKEVLQSTFSEWDKANKGYLEPSDVVAIAEEQDEDMTEDQASRLIHYSTRGKDQLVLDDFRRIFHPEKR